MTNYFESPFKGIPLTEQVRHPNIRVGRYSYYSGWYHGHGFDDCARYLMTEPGVDRLIIGDFCSIQHSTPPLQKLMSGIPVTTTFSTRSSRSPTCGTFFLKFL